MDGVVHFEIPADDVERAQKFYSKVFGWKMNPMPEMNYTILMTTEMDLEKMRPKEVGAINGGMMKRNEMIKGPVITIDVDDIEEAIKKVEAEGGKMLVGKQSIGEMGFTAYVKDPEGNVIGLWQRAPK